MQHFLSALILICFTFSGLAQAQDLGFEPIEPIVPTVQAPQNNAQEPAQNTDPNAQQTPQQNAAPSIPSALPEGRVCGQIHNQSPHRIYGGISTNIAGERQGTQVRHRETFSLEADEKLDVCSEGPFYEGQRLELTLRALFPLFSCKTQIASRVIAIRSEPREDGTPRFFAQCF